MPNKLLRKMKWHQTTYGYALTNIGRFDIPTSYGPLEIETVHGPLEKGGLKVTHYGRNRFDPPCWVWRGMRSEGRRPERSMALGTG